MKRCMEEPLESKRFMEEFFEPERRAEAAEALDPWHLEDWWELARASLGGAERPESPRERVPDPAPPSDCSDCPRGRPVTEWSESSLGRGTFDLDCQGQVLVKINHGVFKTFTYPCQGSSNLTLKNPKTTGSEELRADRAQALVREHAGPGCAVGRRQPQGLAARVAVLHLQADALLKAAVGFQWKA